jgi:tRNA A-37 threonylcarbamoyl transferase component Bud32
MGGPCLSDEAVAAFVEGRLPSENIHKLQDHMASCPACRQLVSEAARCHFQGAAASRSWLGLSNEATLAAGPVARTADSRAETLPKGAQVSRYEVLETVGIGGMGVVYAARDPQLGRTIALKLLRSDRTGERTEERLLREAQAMARISHPNVVAVHDAGAFEGQVFVAMELVDGKTLGHWLHARARSWQEIVRVFEQAGQGLAAAHDAGLVHRDFKPENVLVGANGRVRVTDFGIARPARLSAWERERLTPITGPMGSVIDATLTRTGAFVGTPAYMAPEQFAGDAADARSDQFSFCVALYEALYCERPFVGDDLATLAVEVVRGRVRDAPQKSDVPQWLRGLLLRGLRTEPAERFPTTAALIAALRGPATDETALVATNGRRWGRVVLAFASAGVLATGGVVAWQASQRTAVAPAPPPAPRALPAPVAIDAEVVPPPPVADAPAPMPRPELHRPATVKRHKIAKPAPAAKHVGPKPEAAPPHVDDRALKPLEE